MTTEPEPESLPAQEKKPIAIIIRGIPGFGKSTLAEKLAKEYVICSADKYFISSKGKYNFNFKKLSEAHKQCKLNFENAVNKNKNVIIDNTNISLWEFKKYIEFAFENNYHVKIIEFECNNLDEALKLGVRNKHGVPKEKIIEMYNKWDASRSDVIEYVKSNPKIRLELVDPKE